MKMNMDFLKIYNIKNHNKIRLGDNGDGGHVIVQGCKYDCFISAGLGNNISFENDFLKKYNIPNYCFDGTIDKLPTENKKINFINKNVGFI